MSLNQRWSKLVCFGNAFLFADFVKTFLIFRATGENATLKNFNVKKHFSLIHKHQYSIIGVD